MVTSRQGWVVLAGLSVIGTTGCWGPINAVRFALGPTVKVSVSTEVQTETGEKAFLPNTRYTFTTYDNPLPRPASPFPTNKHGGTFVTDESGQATFTTLPGYVEVDGNWLRPNGAHVVVRKVFEVDASQSNCVIKGKVRIIGLPAGSQSVDPYASGMLEPYHDLYTSCFPKVCNEE